MLQADAPTGNLQGERWLFFAGFRSTPAFQAAMRLENLIQ
jgi:hypothetical protein